MEQNAIPIPRVFISYSHDSPDHKRWVADLATKLMENGVDVILDQWDLGLGDDVPKFMEKSVSEADRVLMVCTETYVHKANEGSGGVGYEAMIVTGELVQNLGTSKFIPVVRQISTKPVVPKSVSTRLYVNLSDATDFQQQLERLLKELHNVPPIPKPPLGKRPYPQSVSAATDPTINEIVPLKVIGTVATDIKATYELARELIRQDDIVGWRALIKEVRKPIPEALAKWRAKYEGVGLHARAGESKTVTDSAAEAIELYAPLFSIALAGVGSNKTKFNNQIAILDDILYPKNWNLSGSTDIVYLPEAVAFVYQALHGAICLSTDQLNLAVRLARQNVGEGERGRNSVPLYKTSEIVGWPSTLGRNSRVAWDFLWQLPERWRWLDELYGEGDDYRAALCAYYMILNIIELVETLADGQKEFLSKGNKHLEVPIRTPAMPRAIVRKGYRLLLNSPEQLREIWRSRNVSEDEIKQSWIKWISLTARALRSEYPFEDIYMIQENLFDNL